MFNKIRVTKPKYNKFNLSHTKKLSLNFGDLVPVYLEEIIPGDKFKVSSEVMARVAPMLAPVMHQVNIYIHYFFVPNRLVHDGFKDFITGGEDGFDVTNLPHIQVDAVTKEVFTEGSLADYFGIPLYNDITTVNGEGFTINALPFRAYQLIYNEYYRDQNLTSAIDFSTGNSNLSVLSDITMITTMRKRALEKDYFTSALPWAQRGADVNIPITLETAYRDSSYIHTDSGGKPVNGGASLGKGSIAYSHLIDDDDNELRVENIDDENTSLGAKIRDFRQALKLQEWLEKNARAGSRYVEQIFSHFGIKSSDARLQRPEYLGGGKTPIMFSEVLNTTGQVDDTGQPLGPPQGDMAGHGLSIGKTNYFKKSFEEHGYILGIMSILPRTAYFQGVPRTFVKKDKFEFYWPEFAHIGEQEVYNGELYASGTKTDTEVFGYQPRYNEYKFGMSTIHGNFRSSQLDFWHLGRKFDTLPSLSTSFVECDSTEFDRIFPVQDDSHKIYAQVYNKVSALRLMPVFSDPHL